MKEGFPACRVDRPTNEGGDRSGEASRAADLKGATGKDGAANRLPRQPAQVPEFFSPACSMPEIED